MRTEQQLAGSVVTDKCPCGGRVERVQTEIAPGRWRCWDRCRRCGRHLRDVDITEEREVTAQPSLWTPRGSNEERRDD